MNYQGENTPESAQLEAASAAKLRGLNSLLDWPEIERRARELAIGSGARSPELAAVARALDAVAQGAPGGGAIARERGLWAAAAFAADGNFPSANVVTLRTFPRARAADAATATLICALAPSLRFGLRAQTPLAGALKRHSRARSMRCSRAIVLTFWRFGTPSKTRFLRPNYGNWPGVACRR